MALSAAEKAQIVKDHQQAEGDTGSPEVQVALLTFNINKLQELVNNGPAELLDDLDGNERRVRAQQPVHAEL